MTKKNKTPLMPKATAVWLVDNTTLTFKQIADFCGLHELEVKGIADGEVAKGVMGIDPISNGQLTKEELERCSNDENAVMKISINSAYESVSAPKKKGAKYTPIARRKDKPDAIYWLLKNFPEISDSKVTKLIGTTKQTVGAIRDRTYWDMQNIQPRDPVLLGICSQIDLHKAVKDVKSAEQPKAEQLADETSHNEAHDIFNLDLNIKGPSDNSGSDNS